MTGLAACVIDQLPLPCAVIDSYEYDAYGNHWTVDGSTPNDMLYRGEQYDPDLGLYYLRARYYNPATGAFMSRDPLNGNRRRPMSLHKYLYASSDPVDRLDPTGREDLAEYRPLIAAAVVIISYPIIKCLWDVAWSEMGYRSPGMLCPVNPTSGSGAGSGGGNGSGSGRGGGSGTGPIAGPGNPPPPPITPPGCQGNPQACAGSNAGSLGGAQQIAQSIIGNSQNLGCVQCAVNLANDFSAAGYEGQFVYAQTSADFIVSDLAPGDEAISQNGFHQAVVLDINGEQYVFDNFANGVPLSEWESALHAAEPITYTFGPW
jgi:RHS repeat-associated protein